MTYGEHLAEPRSLSMFNEPRILVQRIVGKESLYAAYTSDLLICNSDIITLLPKNKQINLKFILGILNSKLCLKILKERNVNLDRNAYPKINTKTLNDFPVVYKFEFENSISKLINQVLENKLIGTDTTHLENQIDQLVYQLYGLTEEEIKIVEGV